MASVPRTNFVSDLAVSRVPLTTAEIIGRTAEVIRASGLRAAVAIASMSFLGFAVDLGWVGVEVQLLLSALTIVLQFWITVSLLDDLGLRKATRRRFGAFFLLGIVTGFGLVFGFLLLIIPGVVLFVRWSIAVPAVVANDDGFADALAYSWRVTQPLFWPILCSFLIVYGPAGLAAGAGYILETDSSAELGTAIIELSVNGALIVGWHVAIAIYAALQPDPRYAEVFA